MVAQHISQSKRSLFKGYVGRPEERKTVSLTEKLKTSMTEKYFAIIHCSDTADLAEARQDQSLIVLEERPEERHYHCPGEFIC